MLPILFLSDQIHCSVQNESRRSALGSLLFYAGEQRWGKGVLGSWTSWRASARLQFHNSSLSLLPIPSRRALPGQSAPGAMDMKSSIASSQGATGCPTDPWSSPPFGGYNPGCPHRWDWGRGVYQQALMVSSISHMQVTTSRQKRPQGRQKKGEVVGDSAGWDHWNIFLWTNTVPSSSGGILALLSAIGDGGGLFLYPRSCWTAGDEQGGRYILYSAFFVLGV